MKTRTAESIRIDVDIRPGSDPDARNSNNRNSPYPGDPGPNQSLRHGGSTPANSSIRNVRVGDIPSYGESDLGSMELAGKVRSIPKVLVGPRLASRPVSGAGPLEMQRLEQQQKNAIALGDPDYAPQRELDYESIKDANFTAKHK